MPTDREENILWFWDHRFASWFTPAVWKLMPISASSTTRNNVRKIAAQRRAVLKMLLRAERSFLAILGSEEVAGYFPHGFDFQHSYRYVCSLRTPVRGLLAAGMFRRAVTLFERILSILLEDSFELSEIISREALCRAEVDAFSHNVRLFESALLCLKAEIAALPAN